MKKTILMNIVLLFLLISMSVFCRYALFAMNMDAVQTDQNIYNNAIIDENSPQIESYAVSDGSSFKMAYTYLLSAAFFVMGNFEAVGAYLNCLIQIMTLTVLFVAVSSMYGADIGIIVSGVMSVFPPYIRLVMRIDESSLVIFFVLCVLIFVLCIINAVYGFIYNKIGNNAADSVYNTEETEKSVSRQEAVSVEDSKIIAEKNNDNGEISAENIPDNGGNDNIVRGTDIQISNDIADESTDEDKKALSDNEADNEAKRFIENPLPVPKRKEHKEMDYAIQTDEENDDYDITDMAGMDFFDIE